MLAIIRADLHEKLHRPLNLSYEDFFGYQAKAVHDEKGGDSLFEVFIILEPCVDWRLN